MFDFPNSPALGAIATNSFGDSYIWDGTKWVTADASTPVGGLSEAPTDGHLYGRQGSTTSWKPIVTVSDTTPTTPYVGQVWLDTTALLTYIWYSDPNSSQWVEVGGAGGAAALVTMSDSPPTTPLIGSLWFDSVGLETYVYYNDGNSNQWVAITNTGAIADARYLQLAGGTMTGLLVLSGDPVNALGAATKSYVDARTNLSGYLPLTGGTVTGPTSFGATLNTIGATNLSTDGSLVSTGGPLATAAYVQIGSNDTINNNVRITPAAAGSRPTITTTGADTNIDLSIGTKAAGRVLVTSPAMFTANTGFNNATPVGRQNIVGAKGGNAALASVIALLVACGLGTDSTTA